MWAKVHRNFFRECYSPKPLTMQNFVAIDKKMPEISAIKNLCSPKKWTKFTKIFLLMLLHKTFNQPKFRHNRLKKMPEISAIKYLCSPKKCLSGPSYGLLDRGGDKNWSIWWPACSAGCKNMYHKCFIIIHWGQHYSVEQAICWALPCISSLSFRGQLSQDLLDRFLRFFTKW